MVVFLMVVIVENQVEENYVDEQIRNTENNLIN